MKLLRRYRYWLFFFLASCCAMFAQAVTPTPSAAATTYNLPADLNRLFANAACTASGTTYTCQGDRSIGQESILNITTPITLRIGGTFSVNGALFIRVPSGASPFYFQVDGNFNTNAPMDIKAEYLDVGGTFGTSQNVTITANIRVGAQMAMRPDTLVYGNVTAGSEIAIEGNSLVYGTCTAPYGNYQSKCVGAAPAPAPSSVHHVRLVHAGSAATCTPAIVTVQACAGADSNGACTAYTKGVSGSVSGGGISSAFTIAAGSSSTTASLAVTTPGTVTLAASGFTASASPIYTCWNGSAASCSLTFADSALLVSIPNHKSGIATDFTIRAVRKSDKAGVCVPAFTGDRNINFNCVFSNPKTGTKSATGGPKGGPNGSLMCGTGTSPSVAMTFDASGSTAATVTYTDVGAITVTVTDAKLGISGTDTVVVAPYRLVFTKTPATTTAVAAGVPFAVNVAAQNSSGAATPNFGKESPAETVSIGIVLSKPSATDAAPGAPGETRNAVSTSVGTGVASAAPAWTETGLATLTASLTSGSYLQSGQVPAGATTGEVLYSIPHHYDVALVTSEDRSAAVPKDLAAPRLPWWYSRQRIDKVMVTARNSENQATTNFGKTGGGAGSVTLTATPAGTLADGTLDATSDFVGGIGTLSPSYKLATLETAPLVVTFGAKGVGALDTNAAGATVPVNIRSGRLLLSNAGASAQATSVRMPVTAQYWSGTSWVKNGDDKFTTFPSGSSVVTQNGQSLTGATISGDTKLSGGSGYVTVTRPATGKAVLNLALNLGTGKADVSCLAVHPASTGADLAWLRSQYGSCGDQADPWAA
ncbi:MAG TPA: polymer-forming cytoskeletal protein, partial [Pseudoduganella sp.]